MDPGAASGWASAVTRAGCGDGWTAGRLDGWPEGLGPAGGRQLGRAECREIVQLFMTHNRLWKSHLGWHLTTISL